MYIDHQIAIYWVSRSMTGKPLRSHFLGPRRCRRIPIAGPDKCRASPLCALFFLSAGPEGTRADPKGATLIHAGFLRRKADAWFLMPVAIGHGLFREKFAPVFFADDRINYKVVSELARREITGRRFG